MKLRQFISYAALAMLFAAAPAAVAQTTQTYSWGGTGFSSYQFSDSKRTYDGFDSVAAYTATTEGTVAYVGEAGTTVATSWLNWSITLPGGASSADLTSATLDFIIYDVTLPGTFDVYHLTSPANNPALLGDFEYNDNPSLAPDGPSGAPLAGYLPIGSVDAGSVTALVDIVIANYSGGTAAFAAGGDPDQGPFAGQTRDDILDAATTSIALDLTAVRTQLDGDGALSMLFGTSENPYLHLADGNGAANRDYWEYAADGGGTANTFGNLGPSREMQLNLVFDTVPEPTAALFLLFGLTATAFRRRRHN